METKKVILKVEAKKQFSGRIRGYMKQLDEGAKEKLTDETLSVESISDIQRILTPKRMEILGTIRDCKPKSIYELAKMVKREQANVQNDVNFLADLGFIELEKDMTGRKKTKPKVSYDTLDFKVPLATGVCSK